MRMPLLPRVSLPRRSGDSAVVLLPFALFTLNLEDLRPPLEA